MPLPAGTCRKNCSRASNPPAEAPMPTTGNETCPRGYEAFRGAALIDVVRGGFAEDILGMSRVARGIEPIHAIPPMASVGL